MDAKMQKFINDMEKKFGKNVLRKASDIKANMTKRIPTGSISLDIALRGGIPVGRFTQISGAFSSSKSSVLYHLFANAQNMTKEENGKEVPLRCLLIQGENGSFTEDYARGIGVDTDALLINETSGMEEALEVAVQMQLNGLADVIGFDSFASFVPMKEQDSSMEDSVQMGLKPKLFDEYFRKFQATNNKLSREGGHPCTIIGLNQLREKIGAYGDPEYTPGGRSIGFTASVDLRIRRGDWIAEGTGANKQIIGQQVKFKVHKSKVSIPQKTGMWDFYFDEGGVVGQGMIDNFKEIVLESVAYGVVHRGGAWFNYKDLKVQGADNLVAELRDRPELFEEIKAETMRVALEEQEEELENLTDEEKELLDKYGTLDEEAIKELKKSEKKGKK